MDWVIRLAVATDKAAILQIVEAAYTPYIARIGRAPSPMLADYTAFIAADHVHILEQDGVLQGLVVLVPEQGSLLLDNIAVAPAAQRRGYGRTLLEYAERQARLARYQSIHLYTHELMTENIAIYSRHGYRETHRVEEKGFPRVYMCKTLLDD